MCGSVTLINSELKVVSQFVMSEFAVKVLAKNLIETDKLTRAEKVRLTKIFSERLLDTPDRNYSS